MLFNLEITLNLGTGLIYEIVTVVLTNIKLNVTKIISNLCITNFPSYIQINKVGIKFVTLSANTCKSHSSSIHCKYVFACRKNVFFLPWGPPKTPLIMSMPLFCALIDISVTYYGFCIDTIETDHGDVYAEAHSRDKKRGETLSNHQKWRQVQTIENYGQHQTRYKSMMLWARAEKDTARKGIP